MGDREAGGWKIVGGRIVEGIRVEGKCGVGDREV